MAVEQPLGLREQKKLETWRTIRKAALELIRERGFNAVSIEDIAGAARVSKSTFFNYFESKEAVIFDSDPQEQAHWQQLLDARPEGEAVWLSLRAFFLGYTAAYKEKLVLQKSFIEANPALMQANRNTGERLSAYLSDWVAERLSAQGVTGPAQLIVNMATTLGGTTLGSWQPGESFETFHEALGRNFDLVGEGLTHMT